MTVTIHLPKEVEQAYVAEAQARGVPLDALMQEVLLAGQPSHNFSDLSPEEWVREFKAWSHSHSNLPVLSDEAMSREFIYGERGL